MLSAVRAGKKPGHAAFSTSSSPSEPNLVSPNNPVRLKVSAHQLCQIRVSGARGTGEKFFLAIFPEVPKQDKPTSSPQSP